MLCGMYQISEELSCVQKLQQELRQRKQVSKGSLTMLLKSKFVADHRTLLNCIERLRPCKTLFTK